MERILYVVGIGPGDPRFLTAQARETIDSCEVIVGYSLYIGLIAELTRGKELVSSGMHKEEERVQRALALADAGKRTALICSGDAGVYGLAGLALTMRRDYPRVSVEVVAGVTALNSGAAVLGAPLVHDFAAVSLSDWLTPWEVIEKRLTAAAAADFVIVLYNAKSHHRPDHLKCALECIGQYRTAGTPCGYAREIGRPEERAAVCRLSDLSERCYDAIDMRTTVFIGNSQTRIIDGRLVTPRGYAAE